MAKHAVCAKAGGIILIYIIPFPFFNADISFPDFCFSPLILPFLCGLCPTRSVRAEIAPGSRPP